MFEFNSVTKPASVSTAGNVKIAHSERSYKKIGDNFGSGSEMKKIEFF